MAVPPLNIIKVRLRWIRSGGQRLFLKQLISTTDQVDQVDKSSPARTLMLHASTGCPIQSLPLARARTWTSTRTMGMSCAALMSPRRWTLMRSRLRTFFHIAGGHLSLLTPHVNKHRKQLGDLRAAGRFTSTLDLKKQPRTCRVLFMKYASA